MASKRKSHGKKAHQQLRSYVIKLYRKGIHWCISWHSSMCRLSLIGCFRLYTLFVFGSMRVSLNFSRVVQAISFLHTHSLRSFLVSMGFTIVRRLASFLITHSQFENERTRKKSKLSTLYMLSCWENFGLCIFPSYMPSTDIQPHSH